eukprot:9232727-Pyramimonas_sp.AAC.1
MAHAFQKSLSQLRGQLGSRNIEHPLLFAVSAGARRHFQEQRTKNFVNAYFWLVRAFAINDALFGTPGAKVRQLFMSLSCDALRSKC